MRTAEQQEMVERYKEDVKGLDEAVKKLNKGPSAMPFTDYLFLDRVTGKVWIDTFNMHEFFDVSRPDHVVILGRYSHLPNPRLDVEELRTKCAYLIAKWYGEDVGDPPEPKKPEVKQEAKPDPEPKYELPKLTFEEKEKMRFHSW